MKAVAKGNFIRNLGCFEKKLIGPSYTVKDKESVNSPLEIRIVRPGSDAIIVLTMESVRPKFENS